jgi:anti-sigma regulatory factor (Ser/Thr protein kinase)
MSARPTDRLSGERDPRGPAHLRDPVVLDLEILARPQAVRWAPARVRAFAAGAGADAGVQARIAVAVREAVDNAVRHAYRGAVARTVRVTADIEDDTLEVVVSDSGRGPPATPAGRSGLAMIADRADAFAIRARRPLGTEVWMRFALAAVVHQPPHR